MLNVIHVVAAWHTWVAATQTHHLSNGLKNWREKCNFDARNISKNGKGLLDSSTLSGDSSEIDSVATSFGGLRYRGILRRKGLYVLNGKK